MRTPQQILQDDLREARGELALARAEIARLRADLAVRELARVTDARQLAEDVGLLRAAMELRHTPLGDPLPLSAAERTALERLESLVGRPA